MLVQPSMVTHWKTVSMANPMLSKEVMPLLGPAHFSSHTATPASQVYAPLGAEAGSPS